MSKPPYTCPISGRVYKTKRGALNSEEREKKKEYIRLNSTSPRHFMELLCEKGKEFWGWDVVIGDGVECEITSNFIEMIFSVHINFSKKPKQRSISRLLESYIKGVKCECITRVSSDFVLSSRRVHFRLNLSNFPLIAEKTREYVGFKKSIREWSVEQRRVIDEGHEFAEEMEDIIEINNKIRLVKNELRDLNETLSERTEYYVGGYSSLWYCKNPKPSIDVTIKKGFYNTLFISPS